MDGRTSMARWGRSVIVYGGLCVYVDVASAFGVGLYDRL